MSSSLLHVVPRNGGAPVAVPVLSLPVPPDWKAIAAAKGYAIAARVIDRLHLALRCERCGTLSLSRVFTVRSAQPLCPGCLKAKRSGAADAAGARLLRPDRDDTRYAVYALPCGHEVRRQFELIARAAAGETGIRCDTCHAAVLEAEAQARGWSVHGPDPAGDPRYRLYVHAASGCGHLQRIARANIISGRVNCARCGTGWASAGSALYLMGFDLPGYGRVLKLGFSRDPASRLAFQLKPRSDLDGRLLHVVPIASGHRALCAERRLHAELRRRHPQAVVPQRAFRGLINVGSEIYDAGIKPEISLMLDALAQAPG